MHWSPNYSAGCITPINTPSPIFPLRVCVCIQHQTNSHLACAMDASATAAAVASLGHPSAHAALQHQHHGHPLSMAGENLVTPGGLVRVPHQSSSAMDALMTAPVAPGVLAYDPANPLGVQHHAIHHHPSAFAANGSRMLPLGSSSTSLPVAAVAGDGHALPNEIPDAGSMYTGGAPSTTTTATTPSLIDVNACIESSMESALSLACSGGYVELVRLLLDRNADREHRDKKSHTPLLTAVYANQWAVVSLLLDYGADIEAQLDRTKDTALSIACTHGRVEVS